MPTRDGNKLDYTNDPHMDNGGEGDRPKMGFGGGFSQPGVREVKTFSASSEIGIPVRQSIAIAIGVAVLSFCIYLFTKVFVTTRGDWSLLIGILTIIAIPVISIIALRILGKHFYAVYFDFGRVGFIVVCAITLVIIGIIADFYVSVIVPQATLTLNSEAHIVAFGCAIIGMLVAIKPYVTFFTRQLTNSLRDSDSKYATQSLLLEDWWRKRKEGVIEGEFYPVEDTPQSSQKLLGHHIVTNPAAARSIAPRTEDQYFNMLVNEFLDGIESGQWGTSERSWKKKRLIKAGVDLPVVGDSIRDALISGQWAEWQHPGQPHLGWSLVAPISEIRNGALLKGKNETAPSTDSDVAVGVYEWSPESEDAEDSE